MVRGARIAAAAACAALVGGVAVTAPAPAQDGSEIKIYRDGYGVPHIEASTTNGLAYGTGYALAFDRPFLTEAVRMTAQGNLAELLGAPQLRADIQRRRDYYDAADVQRQYDALPARIRQELQAYVDGFNKGMQEVMADPARRPSLFDALGYTPPPWKPTDPVSVVALFSYDGGLAGVGGEGQLENAKLLVQLEERFGRRRGLRIFNDLRFRHDTKAPTVIPRRERTRAPRLLRQEGKRPAQAQREVAKILADASLQEVPEQAAEESATKASIPEKIPIPRIGSYGAALGPKRTKSGGGLILGSPQVDMTAPSIFWQLGQHGPGRDCTGFTVPGLGPWTGIGWCNDHAWMLVAGNMGEQVDNYVERIDPSDPRRYLHKGEWRRMNVRTETFKAAKCVPPICEDASPPSTQSVELESTVHGAVVARDEKRHIAIAQRRAQTGIWAKGIEAVVGWNETTGLDAFNRATDVAGASYNMLYADAAGHTMYRFTGVQPARARGYDRRLPVPGTGEAEWRGLLRGRAMPHVTDPKSGLIVSNQGVESKPVIWWPNGSDVAVGQVSRVNANRRRIGREGALDAEGLKGVNPDLIERRDPITPVFARHLRQALRRTRDARLKQALQIFDDWARAGYPRVDGDGDGKWDSPAPTIFGADSLYLPGDTYKRYLWEDLLDKTFSPLVGKGNQPGGWLARLSVLKRTLDRRNLRRQIRASTTKALDELAKEFGTADTTKWLRPVPETEFSAAGVVAPPAMKTLNHGTYSHIVDPRAGVGLYILPPGNAPADSATEIAACQAGNCPEHFADQAPLYERYEFLRMPHTAGQYRSAPESVVNLTYPG